MVPNLDWTRFELASEAEDAGPLTSSSEAAGFGSLSLIFDSLCRGVPARTTRPDAAALNCETGGWIAAIGRGSHLVAEPLPPDLRSRCWWMSGGLDHQTHGGEHGTVLATRSALNGSNRPVCCARTAAQRARGGCERLGSTFGPYQSEAGHGATAVGECRTSA